MKRLISVLTLTALLGGCAAPITQRERATLTGGALGAGAGALIGNAFDRPGRGALIGGGIGALGGALLGDQMEGQSQQQQYHARELEAQQQEIARQRRELDDLQRNPSYYDSRSYDRY